MSRKVQKNTFILLILIFINTFLSTPIVVKADVDYVYDDIHCNREDHQYCVFINTIVISAGYPVINKFGYHANMDIYHSDQEEHKAFKIVYGDHNDIRNNEQDKKGEWRYLGFNMDGKRVSNEDFTNDREIGENEKFTDWILESTQEAKDSWKALDSIYNKDSIKEYNWKVKWLKDGKKTDMSGAFVNDESKVILLTHATFLSEGSVKVWHYVDGVHYYSTFTIPAMAKLDGEILSEDGTIGAAEGSVDINLGSKAYFKDNDYLKANKDLISELRVHVNEYKIDTSTSYIKIKEEDKEKYGGSRTEDIEVEKNHDFITFRREDFTEATINNEHLVEFKGTAYYRSDLTGEDQEVELTKTIKITIENRDLSAKSINVKHFEKDMDTGNTKLLDQSTKGFNEEKTEMVTAKSGRTLIEIREGPEVNSMTSSSNSSVQVSVDKFTAGDTYYIEFYYKKIIPVEGGDIVFNPNQTDWTNKGRDSQGQGKYNVDVSYKGDNPVAEGTISIHHHEEKKNPPIVTTNPDGTTTKTPQAPTIIDEYRTESFEVTFEIQSISVSGDAHKSINGDNGDVYIRKEGGDLKLNGEGTWGKPKYKLPPLGKGDSYDGEPTLPNTPDKPTGNGGVYMLDWTTPVVRSISSTKTDGPINGWTNEGKDSGGYRLDFTVYESDLSGYNETRFTLNDSSYYRRDDNGKARTHETGEWETNLKLRDGIYDLDIDLNDIAGNTDSESYGLYKIDHTDPTIDFVMGENGFDGTLTIADNLSGIYQSTYRWLQHHEDEVGFDYNEYKWRDGRTKTYTYFDEGYDQIIKDKGVKDINKTTVDGDKGSFTYSVRKPRGDHWYLHVWTRDRAGNVTTRVFRNYDDPIKLKGLKVIDITDYSWTPQFWDLKQEPKKLRGRKFGPDEMPIDETTNGGIPGINISKGYAVVFEIKSEYLDFREDTIVIKPTFFYLKDGKRIPCDLYYQLERNPFIKYGSEDDKFNVYYTDALKDNITGTFTRLELEKNERQVRSEEENVWRFKYYIHYNTYAVEKGKKVYAYPTSALKDGEFLIQFDVKAYRNNEVKPHDFWMRYDYVSKDNRKHWEDEGGFKVDEYGNRYWPGDVIIFDEHSIIDDYDAGGVY